MNVVNNVDKLPDCYDKRKGDVNGSNNYKLLNLNELATADIRSDSQAIYDSRDLNNATGSTLDQYGAMVGQKRGAATDEQYRYLIQVKIGINTGTGTLVSVRETLSQMFNCKPSDIIIVDSEKNCEVDVISFPMYLLFNAGFTSDEAIKLVESLLPTGVKVNNANFDGSFEFSAYEDEYDENKGFGNMEQTIGGSLGLFVDYDPESKKVLPL